MSDEGERTCPLCAEEMDLTDQQLKPCRCGYEICVWCWHHIMDMAEKDDTDGRCPACRSPYDKEKIVGTASKCERLLNEINMEKKVKNQKAKSKSADGRKQLSSVRVIQRNLVYIVGLPLDLADEDLLQKREYFGQYGKVLKVSMSRTAGGVIQQFPNDTCSVYITYLKEEEAIQCIQNVHGFVLEGKPLRACFGTTKYCHAWLRNSPCINPDCLYLHEVGSQEDSFTKDEIISAYTRSRVQQITGATTNMQRRSGTVLPPPLDDCTDNSTERPIIKSAPTNSVYTVRSSPPNGINGKHVPLSTSTAWGTQATSCLPPAGGLSNPSVLSKPKPDTVNSTLAFSTAVTGTIQASAAQGDGSRRPPSSDGSHNTLPRVKSELPKPIKQYNSNDSLTSAGEKISACPVSPAPVNLKSELSSRPLSRDNDRGNCTIANTLNSTDITGHSFNSGPEEAVPATSEVIRNLSSEFSSINIGRSSSIENYGITKPSNRPTDHVLSKSPQIQEGSQYDVDRFKDPITTNVVGKTSTSDSGIFSLKEQCGGILKSQSQVLSDTADIEDDVTSFDNQRLKDPEVCRSYLPKATNFLNVSKLSSPCLMPYGEPCTAGNAGSLSSDDRVRDESILHSSSMLCNGYPEKLISGSSNGLLHDERNRQSIGRLVGDAVNTGCDVAIDKGESNIISNILSIDFDPWDDSLTSPHNIVKLLTDNTDSQPGPLKKSSSWKVQRNSLSVVVCAALLCIGAASDVIELTDSSWDSEIGRHEIALAEFYAPWCGHCKRLAPEYEKAATKLKSNDPPISLIKVDCTAEKATCDKFGVSGFPTLKIFRNGEVSSDYDGPREADGIIKYMRGQAGPSSRELKSVADFEKFVENDDVSVIGLFEGESKLRDSFLKVADTERDRFRFAHTSDPDVLKKTGYNDDIVVYVPKKLQNKFDPNEFKYDGNYDTDKIKNFLVHETNGLAGIRTSGNLFQYTARPLVVVYYNVDYVKDPKGSNYWRNRVLKVAQDYKRKVYFAVSNKDEFGTEIEQFGLADRKESDKPLVAAFTKDGKFPLNKEFSIDNLKQFVEDLLANKLEPYMKSEPVPTEQEDLKVAVAKNFKELIMDSEKDALVEFYAPWCGHCKALAPKLEELATKLKDEEVVIAKFDATANDVPPQFEVRGFPTLYWIPKNARDAPVAYNGGREVKDFVKYIAQHSTDGLKGYSRDGKKKKNTEL